MAVTSYPKIISRDSQTTTSEQESTLRASLINSAITNNLMGIYFVMYLFTIYLYKQMKGKQSHVVIITTTVLFVLILAQMGLGWYADDRVFIKNGSTRESVYVAETSTIPPKLHLLGDILFFSGLITVDILMVWRCYHVWGKSWRVILIPCILLSSECAILLSLIIIIAIHISNVTLSVARVLDILQITLYSIPAAISVICTYLISHRIFFSSLQNKNSSIGRTRRFRKIIDIIVQSSVVYTVTLICTALTDGTKPHAERSVTKETMFSFISSFLTPLSGLTSTLMVARVGLISAKFNGTIVYEDSLSRISAIQFVSSGGEQIPDAMPADEQDMTEHKSKVTACV